MATGACSREEPQPKLPPPMTIGYSVFILPSDTYLRRNDRQIQAVTDAKSSPQQALPSAVD